MNKRMVASLLALLLLVSLLAGCGEKTPEETTEAVLETPIEVQEKEEVKEDQTSAEASKITYAMSASPEGKFNPLISNTQYDGYVNSLVYSSLLKLNDKIELEKDLAESYSISEDSKVLTFVLRDGLSFHDGSPLTTEDIKFTLEAIGRPGYEGDLQSYVKSIVGFSDFNEGKSDSFEGIKILDDKTIEISFEKPYSPMLSNIGGLSILPKHIWEKNDASQWSQSEALANPVGSGPYKFKAFKNNEYVELEAFDNYHEGKPKIQRFFFKVVNEATVQAELIQKSVDVADVSNIKKEETDALQEHGIEVLRYPNSKMQYMGFNLRDERLKDIHLRTAMAYGIDRRAIVEGLLEGKGYVINTPMVPTLWSYPKEGLVEYSFQAEKAAELLKEAGYEDTDGDGILDQDGENLVLTLVVPTGDAVREQTGAVIKDNLKKIGIEIELDLMDFNAVMEKVVGNHEFELYLMGNTLGSDPDPTPNWYSTQASDEKGVFGWNIAGFRSEEADKLMDQNTQETNQEDRAKTLQEFGRLLNKELPWIPLYAADITKAYSKELKGYSPNTFVDFYNVHLWEIDN